jgi:hypothetical protein
MQATLQAKPANLVLRYETLKWLCETYPGQLTAHSSLVSECLSQTAIGHTTNYLALTNLADLLARTQCDLLQRSLPNYSATLTSIYDSLLDPMRQEQHFPNNRSDSAYVTAFTLMSIAISARLNDVELDASRQGKLHAWLEYALKEKPDFSAPQVHMLAHAALDLKTQQKSLPIKLVKWLVKEIKYTPTRDIEWRHRLNLLKLIHIYAQTGAQTDTRLIKDAYRQVFNNHTPTLPATDPLAISSEKRHLIIHIKTCILDLLHHHLRAEDAMDGMAALILEDDNELASRSWWLEQLSLFIHHHTPEPESQKRVEGVAQWLLATKTDSATWHKNVLANNTAACWQIVHALPQFSSLDLSRSQYNTFWQAVLCQVRHFTTEQQVRTLHVTTHYSSEILAALFDTIIGQLTPKLAQLTPQDRDNTLKAMARYEESYPSQACELLYQIAEQRASLTADQKICLLRNLNKVPASKKRQALTDQLIAVIDSEPKLSSAETCRLIHARTLLQFKQLSRATIANTLALVRQSPTPDAVKYLSHIWPAMMLLDVQATVVEQEQLKAHWLDDTAITSKLEKDIRPTLAAIAAELGATLEKSPWIDSTLHPADFAFKRGSECVYIEIDGPPHFDHTGEPNMRFYLRKRMYAKAGVEYIAIQIPNRTSAIKLKNSNLSSFAKEVWHELNHHRKAMEQAVGIIRPARAIRVLAGNKRSEASGGGGAPARPGAGSGGGGAAPESHQHARPRF